MSAHEPLRSTSRTTPVHRGRAAAALTGASIAGIALNTAVATVGVSAGAAQEFGPLHLATYGPFTVVGILVGWLGWRMINRRAPRPTAVLKVVVPIAVLASWAPDLVLLATRFIPGTSATGVLSLMAMHLVVTAVAIPAYVFASRSAETRSSGAALAGETAASH